MEQEVQKDQKDQKGQRNQNLFFDLNEEYKYFEEGEHQCSSDLQKSKVETSYFSVGWPNPSYEGLSDIEKTIAAKVPASVPNRNEYIKQLTLEQYQKGRGTIYEAPEFQTREINNKQLKVFCWTWNAESLGLCAKNINDKFYGSKMKTCHIPLFTLGIQKKFYDGPRYGDEFKPIVSRPDILVFSMQESTQHGDYLMSYTLPYELSKMGYVLLHRRREMGVGQTGFRGLRSSIFVSIELYRKANPVATSSFQNCPGWTGYLFKNKGGIITNLTVLGQSFVFINMHLPFYAGRLKIQPYTEEAKKLLKAQRLCFLELYKEAVVRYKPNYIFAMGDMNFRTSMPLGSVEDVFFEDNLGIYPLKQPYGDFVSFDELTKELVDLKFSENNEQGPNFPFTCKMLKGRPADCGVNPRRQCYQMHFNEDINKPRRTTPSWCDRILYKDSTDGNLLITTDEYNNFDAPVITCSDHASVYGIFTVKLMDNPGTIEAPFDIIQSEMSILANPPTNIAGLSSDDEDMTKNSGGLFYSGSDDEMSTQQTQQTQQMQQQDNSNILGSSDDSWTFIDAPGSGSQGDLNSSDSPELSDDSWMYIQPQSPQLSRSPQIPPKISDMLGKLQFWKK